MPDNTPQTVTPLEGKTSIDDKMTFGPQRLSYASADAIAQQIASQVADSVKDHLVVIAGTSLLVDFANLQSVYLSLESLRRDYDAIASHAVRMYKRGEAKLPELKIADMGIAEGAVGVTGALAPVTSALSAAIGLVSLFRQDVEYHGAQTTVDALAFELALAACVKNAGAMKVFVPDLCFLPSPKSGAGSLQGRLANVQNSKAQAWAAIGPSVTEVVHLEAKLEAATREKNQKLVDEIFTQLSDMRRDLDPLTTPLSRADQRLADFQTQWNQTDPASGLTLLARLLRAEAIQLMNPRYLHAAVVSSGGYNRISHNLFRTMFLGDGLSFTGGAIARWALLDKDGSVTKGGISTAQFTWGTLLGFHDSSR